jgi:murein DD-endopeptidase MepM/ murein hydrolase activator NlpD
MTATPLPRCKRVRKWLVRGFLLLLVVLTLAYVLCTGPRDLSLYPPRESSPYLLPWPAGESHLCVQGNCGVVSHRGWDEFSYDFTMPVGSDVLAARGGKVVQVEVRYDGNGYNKPSNYVILDHGDGTLGGYFHIRHNGSYVSLGQRVLRGQRIAASGNVGHSMLPHLHFMVFRDGGDSLPITFADVAKDAGVPRMAKFYTSGNQPAD